MNVNNTKITAPINQLFFSLLVCLLTYLFACLIRLNIHIESYLRLWLITGYQI